MLPEQLSKDNNSHHFVINIFKRLATAVIVIVITLYSLNYFNFFRLYQFFPFLFALPHLQNKTIHHATIPSIFTDNQAKRLNLGFTKVSNDKSIVLFIARLENVYEKDGSTFIDVSYLGDNQIRQTFLVYKPGETVNLYLQKQRVPLLYPYSTDYSVDVLQNDKSIINALIPNKGKDIIISLRLSMPEMHNVSALVNKNIEILNNYISCNNSFYNELSQVSNISLWCTPYVYIISTYGQ